MKRWLHDLIWEWHTDKDIRSLSYWRLRPRAAFVVWFVIAVGIWTMLILSATAIIHIVQGVIK